jgi:hypothetical protein
MNTSNPFAPAVPVWAKKLIAEVCVEYGVRLPDAVTWCRQKRDTSSGVTNYETKYGKMLVTIGISAGYDRLDSQHIVLHELAHFIGPRPTAATSAAAHAGSGASSRRRVHDRGFYGRAVRLFADHGAYPLPEAVARETRMHTTFHERITDGLRDAGLHQYARHVRAAYAKIHAEKAVAKLVPARTVVVVPSHPIAPTLRGRSFVCSVCRHRVGATTVEAYRRLARAGLAHTLTHMVVQRVAESAAA